MNVCEQLSQSIFVTCVEETSVSVGRIDLSESEFAKSANVWKFRLSLCNETSCTAASLCSGRHYDPSNGKFMDIYFWTKCDHHNHKGFWILWFKFLFSSRGGYVNDQNDFDKLELLKTPSCHLVFVRQLSRRVAGWHNGIIEGGAMAVNGEQTGSIN